MDIARLVVVGDGARATYAAARDARAWTDAPTFVREVDEAVTILGKELAPQDVVLVKASRAAGLERVAAALLVGEPSEGLG